MENENFAVATLLFMVIMPGKPPYSKKGGEDIITNIINMDFSYPLGEFSNKKAPEGNWKYMWSHLSYKVKSAFYNALQKEGKYASKGRRLSVESWLSIFCEYLSLLDGGKLGERDKMSEGLFPTRYKNSQNSLSWKCP